MAETPDENKVFRNALIIAWIPLALSTAAAEAGAPAAAPAGATIRRVIKQFDFDEQAAGNFESMPRDWRHLRGPGFPRHLEARFDDRSGRLAAPSLYLPATGASIATVYLARDIDVSAGSEYHVEGWIRPRRLRNAAARISAYFLDHAFNVIPGSEVFSAPVHGMEDDASWSRVQLVLPGRFDRARWIAVTCRVEQPDQAVPSADAPNSIRPRDADAAAWFDDIRVLRMPQISLSCGPIAVFAADEPVDVRARVADGDESGLRAHLEILDALNRPVLTRDLAPVGPADESPPVDFSPPSPGYYLARLRVWADEELVAERTQPFVKLGVARPGRHDRSFLGLLGTPALAANFEPASRMMNRLAPSAIKLPVWRPDTTEDEIVRGDPRIDRFLRFLEARRVSIIATLDAPPVALLKKLDRAEQSVLDLLSGPPAPWRAWLALVLTRYGGQVKAWQVGPDQVSTTGHAQTVAALQAVRTELRPLLIDSVLAAPVPLEGVPAERLPAEIVSLESRAGESNDLLHAGLADWSRMGFRENWVTIQPLPPQRYHREARLADLAQKILLAYSGGAATVFVPQPWDFVEDGGMVRVVPRDELIVEATLANALAGMSPAGPVWLDHGVEARLYETPDRRRGALAVWTRGESSGTSLQTEEWAPDARVIDPRGPESLPVRDVGPARIAIDAMPRILTPVDPSHLRLRAGFHVEPSVVQPALDWQTVQVTLHNSLDQPLTGVLRFEGPPGMRLEPQRVSVSLESGRRGRWSVRLRVPTNQVSGDHALIGRLTTDREGLRQVTLRAPLRIVTGSLDVNVLSRREGDDLVVVQRITNRGDSPLNLRASLICPSRSTQTRLIGKLTRGQTAVREYVLPLSALAGGSSARATVEEVDGPARHNALVRSE